MFCSYLKLSKPVCHLFRSKPNFFTFIYSAQDIMASIQKRICQNLVVYYFIIFTIVTCEPLEPVEHSQLNYSQPLTNGRYAVGTVATYTCDEGLIEYGYHTRECEATGNWFRDEPRCIGREVKKSGTIALL